MSVAYVMHSCTLMVCDAIGCTFEFPFRSTPIEVLHTILLEPYKYLTDKVMKSLSQAQKAKILAIIGAMDYSGISGRMTSNVTVYSKSYVGHDFKVWTQVAPFVLKGFVSADQLKLWISLSHVSFFNVLSC